MQAIEAYAKYAKSTDTRQGTIDTYTGHVRRFYRYLAERAIPHETADGQCIITGEVLSDFYVWLYDRELEPNSRNTYVAALHDYFAFLANVGRIDKDPTAILKYAKTYYQAREDDTEPFQDEELLRLFTQIDTHGELLRARNRAFVLLALASAMRVSELCSLTLSQLPDIREGHAKVIVKGGREEEIAIAPFAIDPLLDYAAIRPRDAQTDALFITQKKTPLTRKQAHDHIGKSQLAAGIATGIHRFRHTTLSRVNRFGDAMTRDIACHSVRDVTGRYTHTTLEERRRAIASVYEDLCRKMGFVSQAA